jgi:hypothetical protein
MQGRARYSLIGHPNEATSLRKTQVITSLNKHCNSTTLKDEECISSYDKPSAYHSEQQALASLEGEAPYRNPSVTLFMFHPSITRPCSVNP